MSFHINLGEGVSSNQGLETFFAKQERLEVSKIRVLFSESLHNKDHSKLGSV